MSDIPSHKSLNAQKHRKGNQFHQQYKSRSAAGGKASAGDQPKSRTSTQSKLPSNWEKYDRDIDETLAAAPVSPIVGIDISTLSLLPTSNSQFQLKQDKVFLPRNEHMFNPGEIFELDMNLINLSLATIPFYKRMNMPESLLSENEQQVMNRKALDANSIYHIYLSRQTDVCAGKTTATEMPDMPFEEACNDEVELRTDNLDLMGPGLCSSSRFSCPSKDLETKEMEEWLNTVI